MTLEDVFAQRLHDAMEDKMITPSQLAAAMGVTTYSVHAWKRGDYIPDGYNLMSLALTLGISLDWLMGRENPQPPKERGKQKRGRKLKAVTA